MKLLVGFPPGTGPDVVTRLVGAKLGELLKQQVVIDNQPVPAARSPRKRWPSPADGYNLLIGEVGSISIAPPAFSKLPL